MKTKSVIKKSAMIPTALVAGGAGFVGSYLCEALLAKGARVIVLDNFKTGKQSYVNHLLSNPNFALFDCDINENLPEEIQSVDYIFHLAGLEEYSYAKEVIDLSSLLTNAFGTKNLLDLAKLSEAKLLLLSTIDVYEGRMSQLELSEYFGRNKMEENRYMLAEAKRYAEALVWEYYKKNDTDVRIVRVPEIFGPRMNLMSSGNLGRFMTELISGHDLPIYGEGDEKEFYVYIDDAVSGVLKAMYNDKTKGNIFSLIPSDPVSILELAYMLKGVADSGVQVKFLDARTEGYFKPGVLKMPDTFNLQLLRWEPKVSLKDGLIKSLEALNYSPNIHSFKPAKLIQDHANSLEINKFPPQPLFSLQDVKTMPKQVPAEVIQAGPKGANFAEKPSFALSLPKVSLPVLTMPSLPKLPVLKLPRLPMPNVAPVMGSRWMIGLALLIPALAIFIGFPVLGFYLNAKKAVTSLNQAKASAMTLDTEGVKNNSKVAYESFYSARKYLTNLRPIFYLVKKNQHYRTYDNLLSSLSNFSKATYVSAKAGAPLENLWEIIRPDTADKIDESKFADSKGYFESARNNLLLAQGDFKYVDKSFIPEKHRAYYDEYSEILNNSLATVDTAIPVFASLPELLGSKKARTYLLLFQNSNELRPTGGFIGSYGVLTLEGGKIKDLVLDDIYNPDGQIDQRNIVSVAPAPIEKFLKETRLHLRNANWNPDFTSSANTIEDLYFKVTGEQVDGVFAVDLYFIENILTVTGPLYLSAYNEEINADNIYERAELQSEFNYTEGSAQKRSFLTVLGSKLLERIFTLDRSQLPALGSVVVEALNQKHLLLYFSNDPINALLKEKKWDGSLADVAGDYLYVVDANLGGTKSNYFVKKTMDYQVSALTRDGLLRGTVKLDYVHTGKDSAWPGGPYTDYLRILTQTGAKLTGAKIKIGDEPELNIMEKVITGSVGKYTSFETDFVLQPNSKATITISYDLAPALTLTKSYSDYSLYWQKQPGTSDEDIRFSMSKPFGFKLLEFSPSLHLSGDVFEAQQKLNQDATWYVKLQ